ncbi:MAG TPA: 50S ribosomal protein L17 [Bacteroidales bacterium]|jgi:large subunit ribosomal protein L17|nr:50S ribosomal protein L17 [Bacteroidales bacterium]
MRHQKAINHLGRTSSHRKAMLSNMASSLIMHKRIHTTLAKAKALRTYIEPIITKSKEDSTHSRRIAFSYLQDKEAVTELFRTVAVKIADRPGGYTRILKTGFRLGDNADMCMMELVDFNENLLAAKEAAPKKTTRRRRGTGKKAETTAVAEETPKAAAPKAKTKAKAAPVAEVEKPEEPVAEAENTEPDTPVDNK